MRFRWLLLWLWVVALLVPAVMLTVARLLEPDGGRWVRLVSFTPLAVILYGLSLLLLTLALLAGPGAHRRLGGATAMAVLPLLGLHLWWASGPYVGPATATAAEDEGITVMTANLSYGRADPARVVEVAVTNDTDVLVLNEITPAALTGVDAVGLGEAFPHRTGEALDGVAGTMVFSRLELSDVTTLETSFRGYAMTVAAPAGQFSLAAVHVHPPVGDATVWNADHDAVRDAATALGGPAVVAGDLNATPDHRPLRALRDRGFISAAEAATSGWQPTWPSAGEMSVFGLPVPSLLQIDHVLVDDGVRVLDTESVTIAGTDHRALVVDLALHQ